MLRISNVSKTYSNGVKALDNVSLNISRGMFGLLGPNGAGKSSLMRTIATLQTADSGSILFDDFDIAENPQQLRGLLGYLPQEFGVYPHINAFDLLDHLAILKGLTDRHARRNQIEALLHQTNLYSARKKAVSTYSGGMKRRFGIAQALLGDPKLIIVDEPTAGLDPEERNRFLNMLSEIGDDVVVVLSTHIVEDVRNLCQQMAILSGGQILVHGAPGDLVTELRGRIWQKVVARTEADAIREQYRVISTHLIAGQTRLHVESDTLPHETFASREPDLEDVYFSTINR